MKVNTSKAPCMLAEVETFLANAFDGAEISVKDMKGCHGAHINIKVVSSIFAGKTLVEQHRLVYNALGELVEKIHAIQIQTLVS